MFDLGWAELLVIGIVALIIVGPKDLPVLFRQVGQFVGKARGMAREFSSAMNQAADQSGVREMSSSINSSLKAASNPVGAAADSVKSALDDIDPNSETGKLSAERTANAAKIQAAAARAAAERKQKEAADALARAQELEAKVPAKPDVEKE